LLKEFIERFDAFKEHKDLFNFFRNPFLCSVESVPDHFQLEVVDLQFSPEQKSSFQQSNILNKLAPQMNLINHVHTVYMYQTASI